MKVRMFSLFNYNREKKEARSKIKNARDSHVGSENYCYAPGDLGELVNLSVLNGFKQEN